MFVVLAAILLLLNKPEIRRIEGVESYVAEQRSAMGGFSSAESNTLIAFCATVVLWITPGVLALVFGNESSLFETVDGRLDEGIVAVLGAGLLFLLPTRWEDREFMLSWSDAARIDWGTVVLFGTASSSAACWPASAWPRRSATALSNARGLGSIVAITIFAAVLAVIVSETTSNTASAAVVVPIIIPIAVAANVNPFVPSLAATFAASFGFMLPVSTPQNAVVYGSGVVPITKMIRSGASFDVLGVLLMLLLPVMAAVVGLV